MSIEETTRKEFLKALEGLRNVKTKEDLEKQQKLIQERREQLLLATGIVRSTVRADVEAEKAKRKTQIQTKQPQVVRPLGDDRNRVVWICPECGARNVNYRHLKSREERRKFTKWYVNYLEENGEPMTPDETKMLVGHGAPFCMKCSTGKKDVYMVRRKVGDIHREDKDQGISQILR